MREHIVLTPLEITEILGHLTAIQAIINPKLVTIPDVERQSLRKMGEKRTGYVSEIYLGLEAHPEVIPSSFDMMDFGLDRQSFIDMTTIHNVVLSINEKFDDSIMVMGHQNMSDSDAGLKLLKAEVSNNATIKTLVDNILSGHKSPRIDHPFVGVAASGSVTIPCKPGQRFTDTGSTVFVISNGLSMVGAITVAPGDSVLIPAGWHTLRIVNQSATTAGEYKFV